MSDESLVVPDGWELSRIGKYIRLQGGFAFKSVNFQRYGVPLIRITNIKNSNIDLSNSVCITENADYSDFELKKGDVLVAMSGATTGKTGIYRTQRPAYLNQRVGRFLPKNNAVAISYISQVVSSNEFVENLLLDAIGGAQPNVSGSQIESVFVNFPPLPEQKKIASILSSVDDVIEKTEAQINKLQDLKKGMMQELLTKGIGHTEFKDSPVGRIPKAWECVLLDLVAKRGSGHTPDKKIPEYWSESIKWVSLADSNRLDKLYIHDTRKKISELGIDNSSAVLYPEGMVVMSRDAGVGKSAITTDEMAVSQHFIAWNCGEELNKYYLYYLLQYWKPMFETIAIGSTIKTIGLPFFKAMKIPVPPINEQEKISVTLLSIDKQVFSLQIKLVKIKSQKKALMQDLLTGKVRVSTNENSKEAAVG